ncbi:hypothetical protein L6248_00725, partial [Candidatus Parcubacteria bacterium]|nr:hypothetical protein [Candidatus Parcubacteria bacterium]
ANDMHSACDEIVKINLGDPNKTFKNICNKEESKKLGLNGHQKEISKNLKNWIDSIKHGSIKNYNRDDIEMIISITAAFLRFIIKKYELRK